MEAREEGGSDARQEEEQNWRGVFPALSSALQAAQVQLHHFSPKKLPQQKFSSKFVPNANTCELLCIHPAASQHKVTPPF